MARPRAARSRRSIRTGAEIDDAIRVLAARNLHRDALAQLEDARRLARRAADGCFGTRGHARAAIRALEAARDLLVDPA